jgi:hypothetical protein
MYFILTKNENINIIDHQTYHDYIISTLIHGIYDTLEIFT